MGETKNINVINLQEHYVQAVLQIKQAVLQSRYRAATLANKEMLSLYYGIGKYVSENSRNGYWGDGSIETISQMLQAELPGLRGFGVSNIKNMRVFYESWHSYFDSLSSEQNRQSLTGELQISINELIECRQLAIYKTVFFLLF